MYYTPAKFDDDMSSGFCSTVLTLDIHTHKRTERINALLSPATTSA